jgi:hypothetical protein
LVAQDVQNRHDGRIAEQKQIQTDVCVENDRLRYDGVHVCLSFVMLIVVSPAKSLDYTSTVPDIAMTEPLLMDQAQLLIDVLKHQSVQEVRDLMDISEDLGQLNVQRFRAWQRHPDPATVRQAIFAFNGDVYEGWRRLRCLQMR